MNKNNGFNVKKSMILEKPSGSIAITDPMSALQRKFYNAFLYVAREEIKKDIGKQEFSIPLVELKKFFNIEDKKNTYIKGKIKELVQLTAEFNILGKDKKEWGIFSLLPFAKITLDSKTKAGIITFEIPTLIKKAILNKEKNFFFAKIDLIIIRGLRSKYSVILYELLKDYENVEIPEMSIEDFRKIFGITDKYKLFQNLKVKVINPAIKEINENPKIDWEVSYTLLKTGVKYTHIKFKKVRKQAQKKIEQVKTTQKTDLLLQYVPEKYKLPVKKLLNKELNNYPLEYLQYQIKYANKQENIKNYTAYLAKAIKEDYADFTHKAEREAKTRKQREEMAKQEQETRKKLEKLRKKMQQIEDEAEKEFSMLPEEEKEKLMQKYMSLFANKNIAKMSAIGEIARLKMEKQMSKEDLEFLENHKNL